MAKRVEMALHPVQAAFLDRKSKLAGFVGGRGTGKTTVGAYDLFRRAKPKRTYMVVAPTYPMLKDASFKMFTDIGERFSFIRTLHLADMRAELGNGAQVLFRSAENPNRLRGPNLSGVWLDEASQMKQEAFDVTVACLREGGEQGWLSATFTPNGRSHWTYEVFGKGVDGAELFHARTVDNPFLPEEFYETVKHQYSSLRAAQELEGQFVDIEGAEWPADFFGPEIWFNDYPRDCCFMKTAAWDPSKGRGSKYGDYSAFVTVMLCTDGVFYVDAQLTNDRPLNVGVETVIEIQRRFQPHYFGIEANQFQELLVDDVTDAGAKAGVPVPVVPIDNRVNKEVRILRLTPYLSRKLLRFKGGSPGAERLVDQMRDFNKGLHDDGPDALEMAIRLLEENCGGHDDGLGGNLLDAVGATY
jgi:predicted phage terminase large subunit-like protein